MLSYPIDLQGDSGTVLASSPDFPELTTFGEDSDEALARAVGAIEEAIAARMEAGQDIPQPSAGGVRVALPALTASKAILYQEMRDQGDALASHIRNEAASQATPIHEALRSFAAAVAGKRAQLTAGEPEEQLRTPFENLMSALGAAWGWPVVCTGEAPLPDRLGRPDFAVHNNGLLAGYVELKAPGTGADASRFKGRNKSQFKRFAAAPNILYSDGDEWALYRGGKRIGTLVRLSGSIVEDGAQAVGEKDAAAIERLLRDFLCWEPALPMGRGGRINLREFAALLAPLCRMLRDDVADALQDAQSPLAALAQDWRQLLFPDATDAEFADAYAQTVAFALLLGRSEGAEPLTLESAQQALATQHSLLSRALQVLTDLRAQTDMQASLGLLLRVLSVVPRNLFAGAQDPWLHFYEDFLAAYDPKLRKNAGAYYTPLEVVHAQVRLVDELLASRLGKPAGFADPEVFTLDPAVGTGTYLLGVIEHSLGRVEARQGAGAVAGQAAQLARNLYGFELLVGPYAVSELRISRALGDRGATLPKGGTHIYLTDTLESPHAAPPQTPLFLQPIAEQHRKALAVKSAVPVIVCLGNPPYDRHEAATAVNKARTGGWVRWGDEDGESAPILSDFLEPAKRSGHGVRVKNLYNLYVYFWRWALWKVFEHESGGGPGILSFISASSYLDGDAFCGMREHLRRVCDEIWILDLGGEGRGTHRSDNVFAIQTPVAIAVAVRSGQPSEAPASVRYARIEGTRREKLDKLEAIDGFGKVDWRDCPDEWQAPFRPPGEGVYFAWPLLTDLMPWQQSGVKAGRNWVLAPEKETLNKRWRKLLAAGTEQRRTLFKESPTGRKLNATATQLPPSRIHLNALSNLAEGSPTPKAVRFTFRSFDRQFVFADARLLDRPGPALWQAHSERQIYLTTALTQTLGSGPALTACAAMPDLHHFSGRGAKDTIPLYRTADSSEANILPGLLGRLGAAYERNVTPEDFLAYLYGVLAHPAFVQLFAAELETRELRAPITKDAGLFAEVCAVGARLLWLHTYGERFVPNGEQPGAVPQGAARCLKAVPGDAEGYPKQFRHNGATQTLHVGQGEFAPVAPQVYDFEVSGLKVVQSWLKYRMRDGGGKKSSPLDGIRPEQWTPQFTTELLELLWVIEATLALYPKQAQLLEAVTAGNCLQANELKPPPDALRKPPKAAKPKLL